MSPSAPLEIFVHYLQNVPDPRSKHGTSHPFPALCSLVILGLLARINEMAVQAHWEQLREPLGFTRPEPPSATCISRTLAGLSLTEFRDEFAKWIQPQLEHDDTILAAAVDGCEPHGWLAPGPSGSRFESTLLHGDREAGSNSAVRLRTSTFFCTI